MDLEEIRRLLDEGRYEFSLHAQQERLEENIDIAEIEEAVLRFRSGRTYSCCFWLGRKKARLR